MKLWILRVQVYERLSNTIYEYEFRHTVEIISDDNDPVYKIDDNQATDLSEILTKQFWMKNLDDLHSFQAIITDFSSVEFENNVIIGLKADSLVIKRSPNPETMAEPDQDLSLRAIYYIERT